MLAGPTTLTEREHVTGAAKQKEGDVTA